MGLLDERFALLYEALNLVSEGVSIIDVDGCLLFFNQAAETLEELTAKDILGKHIKDVYHLNEKTSLALECLITGNPVINKYHRYATTKGKKISVMASTFPIKIDGKVVGVVSTAKDISLIKELLDKNAELVEAAAEGKVEGVAFKKKYTFESIVGESQAIREAVAQARGAGRSALNVLLYGETGTGKELFAQSIHYASANQHEPFIGINCAAIPDSLLEGLLFGTVKGAFTGAKDSLGLFIQAGKGTVFLDEVNSMNPLSQAKLLRVLQEKCVQRVGEWKDKQIKCRIISSTNVEPEDAVRDGTLRKDLFYRLGTVVLYIPSLRERIQDVQVLTRYFIEKYNLVFKTKIVRLEQELEDALMKYSWPGNVRELEHIIESTMSIASEEEEILKLPHVPKYTLNRLARTAEPESEETDLSDNAGLSDYLRNMEHQVITKAMQEHHNNISQAAQALGIKRQNLQMRLKKLGLGKTTMEY